MSARKVAMTEDEVRALPVAVDLPTAARALGLGRTAAYELVRSGAWPTPVPRLGRLIKVPRAPLLIRGGGFESGRRDWDQAGRVSPEMSHACPAKYPADWLRRASMSPDP